MKPPEKSSKDHAPVPAPAPAAVRVRLHQEIEYAGALYQSGQELEVTEPEAHYITTVAKCGRRIVPGPEGAAPPAATPAATPAKE